MGHSYPLHSLAGALAKYYEVNKEFQSEFVYLTLKSNISMFDKYNSIRNLQSYAHDNEVLSKSEAAYVVRIVTATLTLISELEKYGDSDSQF